MTPLQLSEFPPLDRFAHVRGRLRDAVIAHKAKRRVAVGERVTLLFEDRETIRWQILEMCRVEGTRDAAALHQEIEVYNELIPGEGELSATLFVEITDSQDIRRELDRLVGLDEHVALLVGDEAVTARFDPKQMDEDRISAVQYIRFSLSPDQIRRFEAPGAQVRIRVDHPRYQWEATLSEVTRRSLCVDLHGDPEPLVNLAELGSPAASRLEVLALRRGVRAIRPAGPGSSERCVIEPLEPCPSLPDAPPEVLMALLELAREMARQWIQRYGGCHLSIDASASPPRLELRAGR